MDEVLKFISELPIVHYLNDDGAIAWCGVARSKENFGYRLTDEKKARLRAEGKVK